MYATFASRVSPSAAVAVIVVVRAGREKLDRDISGKAALN
jgi:hypothetical protein